MQDAVSLIGKIINIDGQLLTVKALYFVPGTDRIYVGMATARLYLHKLSY